MRCHDGFKLPHFLYVTIKNNPNWGWMVEITCTDMILLGHNASSYPVPYPFRIDFGFPESVGPRNRGLGQESGAKPRANPSLEPTPSPTIKVPSRMDPGIFYTTKRNLFLLFDLHARPQTQDHFDSYPRRHKLIWYVRKTFHFCTFLKVRFQS